MANKFNVIRDQLTTRHFGGTKVVSADPYTSGTFFIWFTIFPEGLKKYLYIQQDIRDPHRILSSLCTGVTPAGGTVNKVEYTGLGGIKWATPGSVEYGTSVTLKFLEMQGTPVRKIIHHWVKMIRDNRVGVSGLPFKLSDYSATMLYWTMTPELDNVETAEAWDGVYPLKDPQDLYPSSIETIDKIEPEIEFNVNRIIEEKWVYELCEKKADYFRDTVIKEGMKWYKIFPETMYEDSFD